MPGFARHRERLSPTWRLAILGGCASIPLTLWTYWRSGMGGEMSLSAVVVGGLLAGYLAAGREIDVGPVGFRAGLVGALPGLWIVSKVVLAAFGPVEPAWFRGVWMLVAVALMAFSFFLSAVTAVLGAKVGGWLAGKIRRRGTATAGN